MYQLFKRNKYSFLWPALLALVCCLTTRAARAQDSFGGEMMQVDDHSGNLTWVTIGPGSDQISQNLCNGCPIYTNSGSFLGYGTSNFQEGAPAGQIDATTYSAGNDVTVTVDGGDVTITWPDGSNISTSGGNYTADGSSGSCSGCTPAETAADYAVYSQQLAGVSISTQLAAATNGMNAAAGGGNWLLYQYYEYYSYFLQYGSLNRPTSPTPPPPPPPPPPSQSTTQKLTPCGGLTFISPEGTPITLPAGSTIGSINLDPGVYTNGALYSFFGPDGTEYMEREASNYTNSSSSTPTYLGYYQVITGAKNARTWGAGPLTPFTYPVPVNGVVQAIRLRVDVNCNLLQEPISYTVGTDVPSTIGTGSGILQNDDVENAPTTGSPCSTTAKTPGSCTYGAGDPNADRTQLSTYLSNAASGQQSLPAFLNAYSKNSVKFYFVDCQTGNVTNTWDASGRQNLSGAAQTAATNTFNNGTFSSTDATIAIEVSVCGGKWNYQVKLNPNNIHPDSKIAPVLSQVEAQIQAEVADEVKKLKVPGQTEPSETYTLPDGESFRKMQMDLLEAVGAIYDVGVDIINTGQLPTKMWDMGNRANNQVIPTTAANYHKSPFNIPDIMGGASDQLIFEATGAVQLVKTGLEIARHPIQSATSIWNTVKSLDFTKIEQIAGNLTGISNYQAGGDLATYQGAKNGVQLAMIFISGIGSVADGTTAITESGQAVTGLETFIPPGTTGSNAANVLENAANNSEQVLNLENQNLLTSNKNIVNGSEELDLEVVTENGQEYTEKIVNTLDGIDQTVLDAASPEDLASATADASVNNVMKTQPQPFKDGKAFEKAVDGDANHALDVASTSGVNLTNYTPAGQVQIQLPDGTWCIADNVWYEPTSNPKVFNVVINETKLSSSSPFSTNQQTLMTELSSGTTSFTLKSAKFGQTFPQGATLNVQSMVKTVGNGTPTGGYNVVKIF